MHPPTLFKEYHPRKREKWLHSWQLNLKNNPFCVFASTLAGMWNTWYFDHCGSSVLMHETWFEWNGSWTCPPVRISQPLPEPSPYTKCGSFYEKMWHSYSFLLLSSMFSSSTANAELWSRLPLTWTDIKMTLPMQLPFCGVCPSVRGFDWASKQDTNLNWWLLLLHVAVAVHTAIKTSKLSHMSEKTEIGLTHIYESEKTINWFISIYIYLFLFYLLISITAGAKHRKSKSVQHFSYMYRAPIRQ